MSIHPFLRPMPVMPPLEPYYQTDRRSEAPMRLRPLTALDQMYAYFGSDLA